MSWWWRQSSFWMRLVIRDHFWARVLTLVFQVIYPQRGYELYLSCFFWTCHWESPSHMMVEQFSFLRFPAFSSQVSLPILQEVSATEPGHCHVNQNWLFCFRLSSSFLSNRSFLSVTWGFWVSLELGTFVLSFLSIRSSAGGYRLKSGVDLYTRSTKYYSLPFFSLAFTVFTPRSASPLLLGWLWAAGYVAKLILLPEPTECIGVKLWPIIRHGLLGYAMPWEAVLTTLYYCLSSCSVQLCYNYINVE